MSLNESNECLFLSNNLDVSNNKYIINNNYNTIKYGLYYNINNNYFLRNIPKEHPLGFYIEGNNHLTSNIINYELLNNSPKLIYVSRGNDISFNNGDYFRFYDEYYNLINIANTNFSSEDSLINSNDNFYFMINGYYKFIKGIDYDISKGNFELKINQNKFNFSNDTSFIIQIPENINNINNRISYYDIDNSTNVFDFIEILVNDNIKYFYGDISFTIYQNYESLSSYYLSIKSYNSNIDNKDFFLYNSVCDYIIKDINQKANDLLDLSIICLNNVSKAKYNDSLQFYEFNIDVNRPNINDISNILYKFNYGLFDGEYVIFDICENYPIAIQDNNFIIIDENFRYTKRYNFIDPIIAGLDDSFNTLNFYYDSLKFTVDTSSIDIFIKNLLSVNFYVLDISNKEILYGNNSDRKFVFNNNCENPELVNSLTLYDDISFILYDQEEKPFYNENRRLYKYKLNKFEDYNELPKSFTVYDKYGHDISKRVILNIPDIIYDSLNFQREKVINYSVYDYENVFKSSSRVLSLQNGPFIELNDASYLFQNNNTDLNRINIRNIGKNNNYDLSYEFLDFIEVYFYDNNQNKIHIPFQIYYEEFIDDINSDYNSRVYLRDYFVSNNKLQDPRTFLHRLYDQYNNPLLIYKFINYYFTDNVIFNVPILSNINDIYNLNEQEYFDFLNAKLKVDSDDFNIINIDSNTLNITIEPSNIQLNDSENILNEIGIIGFKIGDNENNLRYNTNLQNITSLSLSSSASDEVKKLSIDKVSSNFSLDSSINNLITTISLSKSFNRSLENRSSFDISINVSLINLDEFKLTLYNNIQNINGDNEILEISGKFKKKKLFDPVNFINLKKVKKYKFVIKALGLDGPQDFIYSHINEINSSINRLSYVNLETYNKYNFETLIESSNVLIDVSRNIYEVRKIDTFYTLKSNISRNIIIDIFDDISPDISFILDGQLFSTNNNQKQISRDVSLNYKYSNSEIFYLKNSINVVSNNIFTESKPTINYGDDRDLLILENILTNQDLSYILIPNSNVPNNAFIYNELDHTLRIKIEEGYNSSYEFKIIYFLIDKSHQKSNELIINLTLLGIPSLDLQYDSNYNSDINLSVYEVNTINYIDPGIKIDNKNVNTQNLQSAINLSSFADSNNIPVNILTLTDALTGIVSNYKISIIKEIDFNNLNTTGIFKLQYKVTKIDSLGIDASAGYLIRNIKVVDTIPPFFIFPYLNDIIIDLSNNNTESIQSLSNRTIFSNDDISNNKNIKLAVYSSFDDLSFVVNSFDISDNYFNSNNIDYEIRVQTIYEEDISENKLFNFDKYIFEQLNMLSINNQRFERVTKTNITNKILDISNIYINYKIADSCNNIHTVIRKLDIIDNVKPFIVFPNINIELNTSYVDYKDNHNKDLFYQALDINNINYDIGEYRIIEELSNILFNFDICDNYNLTNEISNNFTISIVPDMNNNDIFQEISGLINSDNLRSNINNFSGFKTKGNNYNIIYNIFDNQNNNNTIIRNLEITNSVKPLLDFNLNNNLNFYVNENNFGIYKHDFGISNIDFRSIFNYSHPRIDTVNDANAINLISILPNNITSISGNNLYDPSYLINIIPSEIAVENNSFKNITLQIDFYAYIQTLDLSSISKSIYFILENKGPYLKNDINTMRFEAGIPINDVDFITNVTFYSNFDAFYYYNYINDICYTETNFITEINNKDNSNIIFNQINPEKGNYEIVYIAKDRNDVEKKIIRNFIVSDELVPNIYLLGNYSNTSNIEVIINTYFIDPGVEISDLGSNLKSISIELFSSSNVLLKNYFQDNINKKQLTLKDISSINLSQSETFFENTNYKIVYTVDDIIGNLKTLERNITIVPQKNVFIYIVEIIFNLLDGTTLTMPLDNNFNNLFINEKLNYVELEKYELSYSNNLLIYEATQIFDINFNFNVKYFDYNGDRNDEVKNNISVVNNLPLQKIRVGNFQINFQAFETVNYESISHILDVRIIDTKPPILNYIGGSNFSDISSNLDVPLLSINTKNILLNDISFLNNENLIDMNFFTYSNDNQLIYKIPGLKIFDTVHGTTESTILENLTGNYVNIYNYEVNYSYDTSNNVKIIIDNSFLVTNNFVFDQEYVVYDRLSVNSASLKRSINVKRFNPFINLNYISDSNNNKYKKLYHELYNNYFDLLGKAYDYYDGELIFNDNNKINYNFDQNILGEQKIDFMIKNSIGSVGYNTRNIHVIQTRCLPKINDDTINFLKSNYTSNNRIGLFSGEYSCYIQDISKGIRIFGSDNEENILYDISNIINISGGNIINHNNKKYINGDFIINVNDNFNRASIEIIDIDNSLNNLIYNDIFIYTSKCEPVIFVDNVSENITYEEDIILDICSNLNKYLFNNEVKEKLHLSFGRYRFINKTYKNFYNPMKFSLLKDGYHNVDYSFSSITDPSYESRFHYNKNINENNLAGFKDSYIEVIIDGTTPPLLYYYNENFKNMSGEIIVKNNIIFNKDYIILNGNILVQDNSSVLYNFHNDDNILKNKVFLSFNVDLSNNYSKKSMIGLTHKNLNHNMKLNNKKIIIYNFENYSQDSSIKHDISENYLFESKENNKLSTYYAFKYIISDNSNNLTNVYNKIDFTELFFRNGEINNYYNFFKKNLLLDTNLNVEKFLFKTNELLYVNPVKIIDAGNIYQYFSNKYFSHYEPTFTNILDNIFLFNLQVYLNIDLIEISNNKLEYLRNNIFNKYLETDYSLDNNHVFFNNYIITILSDIPNLDTEDTVIDSKSILFTNGNIELNDYLLHSDTTNDYLFALYGVRLQQADVYISYDFRTIYNTNNWEIFGNVELLDSFIFIPNNSITNIDIQNQLIVFSYSTESENKLLYSRDNRETYITNPFYFKNKINDMFFKNNSWILLTSGYNGVYTSNDGIDWIPKQEREYRKISYYKSYLDLKNFIIYYGFGEESILINNKNSNEFQYLNVFETRICNNIKSFSHELSNKYIFFCGLSNYKDKFCLAYVTSDNNVYDISNINNLSNINYATLISPLKFLYTNIANDVFFVFNSITVFVGYVDYYIAVPFLQSQNSIFYSFDNGKTFYPVSNSHQIFKYGYRIINYNGNWIAFGSDVDISGNDIDIRNGKVNYNNNYYVNKVGRSNNGIDWYLDSSCNLFNYIDDVEKVEIKNNTLYVYGNNKYIVYTYNTYDWFVFIENFPFNNLPYIYFNNFNENIDTSTIGNLKLNYVKLDPYTTTNKFTIEIVIKFHTLILSDDDIILNSSQEILDSSGNINYINKILIKRLKNFNNKLYIETTNFSKGHDILIDYSLNTLNYYHLIFMQNNYATNNNDYKIIYINGERIKNENLHNIYYTDASNNLNYSVPIVERDINYINNHTTATENNGLSIQFINFYDKILIPEKILDLFNNVAELINYNRIEYDNSNNFLFESKKEEFKNKIFLIARDTDLVNEDTNRIIGITEQNLYHNIYIEDDTRFLFHKYSEKTHNIQINSESLENTLSTNTSSKNYLLEICNNDLYNCFINTEENNIIDNHQYKNNYLYNLFNNRNDVKYQLHLSYFIYDEIKNTNNLIDFFDVKTHYTNNIDTRIYSTPYGDSSDNYHTNFFIIDVLNFIDRKFYKSSRIKQFMSFENINYDNLNFIIQDISYINHFNMYDLDNSINIIYDKNSIYKLNYIQIYIHNVNIKLNYAIEIFKRYFKVIINGFNNDDFIFINDMNLQNYQRLFESIDYVSNIFSLNLPNISLNDLFALCLFNIKTLINKYNNFFVNVQFHNIQYEIINYNIYDSIKNFNNVDQILTDTSFIELRIDNLLENMSFRNNINNSLYNVLNNIPIINFSDFIKLREVVIKYYNMYQDFNILLYELRVRTIYYSSEIFETNLENMLSKLKDNIFNYDNISDFYQIFINTLINFNNILIYFLENNNFMFESTYIDLSINYLNINRSFNQNITNNISIDNLILEFQHIKYNFDYLITKTDNIFDFISKLKVFDKINYVLKKSRFGINLIESNNITLKIETFYNSYLFNNIYLDTFIIDIAKPDIIKPTIIFNNIEAVENTTFARNLTPSNIENIVNILISDISYVDMYTENEEFTVDKINYYYNNIEVLNNDHYLLSLDLTPIAYNLNERVDISYTIRDFANNINVISRSINVELLDTAPRFFYFDELLDSFNIKNYTLIYRSNLLLTKELLLYGITVEDPDSNFSRIVNIEYELSGNLIEDSSNNDPGFYLDAIIYKATGRLGKQRSLKRDISINLFIPDVESEPDTEPPEIIPINCCYPKVYYKKIQHSYKLGSSSTTVSRLSKIIVNNIR